MKLVIDASVTLKWLLNNVCKEQDVPVALALLSEISSKRHDIVHPPHWISEVMAVVARHQPQTANQTLVFLAALVAISSEYSRPYERAVELSSRLNHHRFDTLYHAVALENSATLVTADERYYSVAAGEGAIVLLRNFQSI